MPHFGFTAAAGSLFMNGGVRVVGMHLNGKFFGGEKKFYENRKIFEHREFAAAPFGRHLAPCGAECFVLKRAGGDAAVDAGEPGFTEWVGKIRFVRE